MRTVVTPERQLCWHHYDLLVGGERVVDRHYRVLLDGRPLEGVAEPFPVEDVDDVVDM